MNIQNKENQMEKEKNLTWQPWYEVCMFFWMCSCTGVGDTMSERINPKRKTLGFRVSYQTMAAITPVTNPSKAV